MTDNPKVLRTQGLALAKKHCTCYCHDHEQRFPCLACGYTFRRPQPEPEPRPRSHYLWADLFGISSQ